MYNLKFTALQCDRMANKFMQDADLLQNSCGIGKKVIISIGTESEPTEDYIKRLEKHIEKMDIDNVQYVAVKCISAS
ncbi:MULTISPECIES: hypothetical protein [Clostridium]|jgi:hypothetical protein|uniref:hypothetical protein n=1 Tax=Clostridium TaxID=1485 RepID=UPI000E8E3B29|nr:hypothetical protein [Clostridium tyrobutyricum]HBF77166.1 hypothetical protein [Clostridiaceae bacterium]